MSMIQTPMSGAEVQSWLPTTPVIMYSEFSKMKSIEDVLDQNGQCVFLYQWIPHNGHWCCMWKRGKSIHVFDPLGIYVDRELSHVLPKYKKRLREDYPYLRELLKNWMAEVTGRNVYWNKFHLQRKTTAVCGRECNCASGL